MVAIEEEEIALSRGESATGSLAIAHAMFPRFCWRNSRIFRMAADAIASKKGPSARNSRADYAQAKFAKSWLPNEDMVLIAEAAID